MSRWFDLAVRVVFGWGFLPKDEGGTFSVGSAAMRALLGGLRYGGVCMILISQTSSCFSSSPTQDTSSACPEHNRSYTPCIAIPDPWAFVHRPKSKHP